MRAVPRPATHGPPGIAQPGSVDIGEILVRPTVQP